MTMSACQPLDELLDALDDRAGGVDDLDPVLLQGPVDVGSDAVTADDDCAFAHIGGVVHRLEAEGLEVGDDPRVVDELAQGQDSPGAAAPGLFGERQGALDAVAQAGV
jgi:hypothetical protein